MAKYIDLSSGQLTQIQPITTSAGAGDANKIAQTDSGGRFDISLMPLGLTVETTSAPASENLATGDFVNFWNDGGTLKVRKADASGGNAKKADGYVLAGVTAPASATVYYGNVNNQCSGLSIGTVYYLSGSSAGLPTATAPSTATHIVQRLGKALSATSMLVEIESDTIVLA